MKPMMRAKVATLMAIGALSLGASLWMIAALHGGPSAAFGLDLAAWETRRATTALEPPPDIATARAATEAVIAQAPADTSAWLRLAYIDSLDGELSAEGVSALERSYKLIAFDQYTVVWRTRFALDHWQALPPELQAMVRSEALGFLRTKKGRALREIWAQSPNPQGRMVAQFWLAEHRRRHS